MKKAICLLICLLLCLSFGCSQAKKSADAAPTKVPEAIRVDPVEETPEPVRQTPEPAAPQSAGDLQFDTVTLYGEPISSDIFHEYDLIVVNFWADWCGWCIYEMPSLERLHQEHPNVLILGVLTSPNSMEDSLAILKDNSITFPTLEPAGTLLGYAGKLQAFPTTLFFDSQGNECADPVIGAMDYDSWAATIEGLLP